MTTAERIADIREQLKAASDLSSSKLSSSKGRRITQLLLLYLTDNLRWACDEIERLEKELAAKEQWGKVFDLRGGAGRRQGLVGQLHELEVNALSNEIAKGRSMTWVVMDGNTARCLRCEGKHVANLPMTIEAFVQWGLSIMVQHAHCQESSRPAKGGRK